MGGAQKGTPRIIGFGDGNFLRGKIAFTRTNAGLTSVHTKYYTVSYLNLFTRVPFFSQNLWLQPPGVEVGPALSRSLIPGGVNMKSGRKFLHAGLLQILRKHNVCYTPPLRVGHWGCRTGNLPGSGVK